MKNKACNKIISLVLLAVISLTLLPGGIIAPLTVSADLSGGNCGAEGDGSNVTWSLDTTVKTLKISGNGPMADYLDIYLVPWIHSRDAILYVIIEDGITNIGTYAFY